MSTDPSSVYVPVVEEARFTDTRNMRRRVPTYIETSPQSVPTVHWDYVTPNRVTAEHQLRLLDRDMQRLAGDMTRLQREPNLYALPPPSFNPRPFAGDFFASSSEGAHAESWRKKENFHLDNPVIKHRDGKQQFRLEFDLRQFKPEEISVTVEGRQLTVQAKCEEMEQGKKARQEYFRQYTIPENVDPRTLASRHSHSGILSIYAPVPVKGEEQDIPIIQQ